jgi:hypothetical protein
MDKWTLIDTIANLLFIFLLILESCYIKKLEHDIDALKSWIEAFWKIDFGAMADAIAEERSNK